LPENEERPDQVAETQQQDLAAGQQLVPAVAPAASRYMQSEPTKELRQSEIITNLSQFTFEPQNHGAIEEKYSYSIILTQDCDLLRDFEAVRDQKSLVLNGVLIYPLEPADDAKPRMRGISWQPVTQNINERFHFFAEVPPDRDFLAEGLPALIMDFRRYFTMPASEIYRQCELSDGARRRCRLDVPYREHLQARAAFYFQRVALP
jgi:hypothetical protein